jgi:hypothetical protein
MKRRGRAPRVQHGRRRNREALVDAPIVGLDRRLPDGDAEAEETGVDAGERVGNRPVMLIVVV